MALTYRQTKGSALTIQELDANFAYFTGSHPINGDLTITGSLIVSGSANSVFDIDLFDLQITGGLDVSRDVAVRDDLTVEDETTLKKETKIGFKDFTNYELSYQLNVTASSNSDKSASFDGGIEVTGSSILVGLPTSEPAVSGQLWLSGSFSNSKYLMVRD
jgi:hypothetical protein